MSRTGTIGIAIAVVVVGGAVIALKEFKASSVPEQRAGGPDAAPATAVPQNAGTTASDPTPFSRRALPKLVDVGAGKCIPCKMMAPILDQLRKEYAGRFDVVFVDVWENPKAGIPYRIRVIPTQIFYDASGRELFRHEGFFSKDDILNTWSRLGFDFGEDVLPTGR